MLARATRGTPTLRLLLRAAALPLVLFALAACTAGGGAATGPFPGLQQYQGREIHAVAVSGDLGEVTRDSVMRVIATRASRCSLLGILPVCLPVLGGRVEEKLDTQVLARDVVRIQLVFRDNGYYGTRVVPTVDDAGNGKVDVRFNVIPGERVLLRALDVTGAEAIVSDSVLIGKLPMKVGQPFRRNEFLASVDTVRNALLDHGYAYAQVLRNYQIDTIADVADVNLQAAPGPLVRVDSIIFEGLDRVSEKIARQQITFREGSLLRSRDLLRSQRNLYDLELIRFATVEVAPESLQVTPDSAQLLEDSIGSTVLIRVGEAPRYAVDASAGYGTVDCFRGAVQHTDRNFLGGARRLQLTASVAKVGVADPLDAGLKESICRAFALDSASERVDTTIAQAMNYRLAAELVQPRLFGTRNSITVGAFTEQISELGLYVRKDAGGQVGLVRDLGPGTLLSTTYTVERGSTQAHDIFFCVVYEVCRREEIAVLKAPRWSNNFSAALIRTRVRLNPFPSGGYQFRVGSDVATRFLGSDDQYLRLLGDGSVYKSVGTRRVVQVRLLAGTFLNGLLANGFIPPQRLFYAGGATTVRGFRRNELGPIIYVIRHSLSDSTQTDTIPSPTGGRRIVVGTVEFTFPTPFRPDQLRVAAFVDGGRVWGAAAPELHSPPFRFTPGAGIRYATPVGPLRLDLSYNPYPLPRGPLYEIDARGNLVGLVDPEFDPDIRRGFLRRLSLHVSIGQTF
ncbi:MAG TPA: BamA/TamA family outer membrane protein [Longimicrobium sp.]|nr:BamA/TamA family outer membrane protein [Longimicrobium sp.]